MLPKGSFVVMCSILLSLSSFLKYDAFLATLAKFLVILKGWGFSTKKASFLIMDYL